MTQTTTTVQSAQQSTKGLPVLKSILSAESVQQQFKNALGANSGTFVASIIDLYSGDSSLQQCEPKRVVSEALKAAVLHLPINKALGYAYVIAYNNNRKDANGRWVKVMEPTFQMGYKGYIQLAMRTGQYRTLNADVVYEGELNRVNKLTGEISFDGERKSDKIVGYFCYFELTNGFSKTFYMTVEQMARHAKTYGKGIRKDASVDTLIALANQPASESPAVGWMGNFHAMAIKTVIRTLLSKYGYLSIEMQNAMADEAPAEEAEYTSEETHIVDVDAMEVEQVTAAIPGASEVPEAAAVPKPVVAATTMDPGY